MQEDILPHVQKVNSKKPRAQRQKKHLFKSMGEVCLPPNHQCQCRRQRLAHMKDRTEQDRTGQDQAAAVNGEILLADQRNTKSTELSSRNSVFAKHSPKVQVRRPG